jgi:hypothetical protein
MIETVAPQRRPATVTIACGLLALTALAFLTDATGVLIGAGGYPDRVRAAAAEAGFDSGMSSVLDSFSSVLPYLVVAVAVVVAVILLVLAALVAAGKQAARIVTWVAVGLAICCNVCGLGSSGGGISGFAQVTMSSSVNGRTTRFSQNLPDGYPEWYQILTLVLAVLSLVSLIAACVLLALPASNAYFRKPQLAVPPYGFAPQHGMQHPGVPQHEAPQPGPVDPQRAQWLAELDRRYQRGELTAEQHAAERARLEFPG